MNFGQGLQGAMGGGMAGSFLGPAGAIGGGLLGGLAGLFGGNPQGDAQSQLMDYYRRMGGMQAPQAGPAMTAGGSPYEQQRAGFLNQLQAWANGQGPSAALQQMRQGMDMAAASQAAGVAGTAARGGGGVGGAGRQAANNTAAMQQATNNQMGVVRSQEQQAAMGMYGNALQGAIGQNQELNQFNAAQQNDMARANLAAKLQALGITTDAQLRALLTALGSAQPGLGTSILAGGAAMAPFMNGANAAGRGGQSGGAGGGGTTDYGWGPAVSAGGGGGNPGAGNPSNPLSGLTTVPSY